VLGANLGDRILRRSVGQTMQLLGGEESSGFAIRGRLTPVAGFCGIRPSRTASSRIREKTRWMYRTVAGASVPRLEHQARTSAWDT
jgi:hypothetical protein